MCEKGTVSQILERLGLRPKVLVKSGEEDRAILDKLGEKVLGHVWAADQDKIYFQLRLKIGAAKTGPDMTANDLENLSEIVFTRRKILGIINDPTGMITAYLVKFKIKMKEIVKIPDLEWDTLLPLQFQQKWRELVREVVLLSRIVFLRKVKPKMIVGRPELVGYWDSSDLAYAVVIYVRWIVGRSSWEVHLLSSKARVMPRRLQEPQRLEAR